MNEPVKSWRERIYSLVMIGCVQFVVLTFLAMLLYRGGTQADPTKKGYDFFRNFFSTLGLTETYAGEPKFASFLLFTIALSLAGLALTLFFIAFPRRFWASKVGIVLTILGSSAGVISGLSFIGIALTPANLFPGPHTLFVQSAFVFYLFAVIPYILVIFLDRDYSNRYAWVFIGFAVTLGIYVWLLFEGPSTETPNGLIIQATGQKIIAYSSIITMFIQGYGAKKHLSVYALHSSLQTTLEVHHDPNKKGLDNSNN
jgi:hypothetical protein